ncbi:PAS domain-containing sensor histidine kinase [Chitinibacter sp. SCUT-21]|uniref:sensor histidine kinase n=1 Tax=Chitinibacter sp. SCUT-21 TaxID=2970891 RepID=UPI0035A6F377
MIGFLTSRRWLYLLALPLLALLIFGLFLLMVSNTSMGGHRAHILLTLQLDLLGVFFLGLFFLLSTLIPFLYFLLQFHKQQQAAIAILPDLVHLPSDKLQLLSPNFLPLLTSLQPIMRQQETVIRELNDKNDLFADALDEINEIGLQLRRSERRWLLALSATGDGIWEWKADKDIWYFSSRWKAILGYGDAELPNSAATFDGFIHPDDVERVRQGFAQFTQSRELVAELIFEAEFRMRHKDGHWIIVLSRAVADRDPEGAILSVVGAQTDITAQRKAMIELSQAKEAAEKAVAQLRGTQLQMIESEKLAALGALVAGVAHEVNTPLGIALTAASTLSEDTHSVLAQMDSGALKKTDLQHYLAVASEASQLILRHCNNAAALIRSFKNISVDQTAEVVRDFDLGLYLDEILQSLKPSLKHTCHTIEVHCPDGVLVHTYPSAFTQIINNLLNNALLHAFAGIEKGHILIEVKLLDESEIELRFMDNGIGIDPSVRAKVFEPFYTTKRGQGGSGLGMSIVHNIVAAQLKGRISIEDTPGGGACFVLVFPRVLKGER